MKSLAAEPAQIVIVEQRADGSGVIEMPVLSQEREIDLSRTATGRAAKDSVTLTDLHQAVANRPEWVGPMPVHRAPHRSAQEKAGPAEGFIEELFVKAGQLWARIDLTASLFGEVAARMWRGFSVDYGRNAKLATKTIEGFFVAGGVFTNTPASDVHARLESLNAEVGSTFVPLETSRKETKMSDQDLTVQLATATAKVEASEQKLVSLDARVKEQAEEIRTLEARVDAAEKAAEGARANEATAKLTADRKTQEAKDSEERIASLETERKDLRARLQAKEDETLGTRLSAMIRNAIKEGVPPARLKVFGDYEKDPVKWLRDSFVSLEAAELTIKALPREAAMSATRSGHLAATGEDDVAAITPDSAAELRRLGLDPRFATVRTEGEFNELMRKQAGK